MNRDLIGRLYQQSADKCHEMCKDVDFAPAWLWEEEFTKAVVLECSRIAKLASRDNGVCDAIEQHFGIEL